MAPRRITLPYQAPSLTTQFFKLNQPVASPYRGSRQGQTGIQPRDIEQLSTSEAPTIGGMVNSLARLAEDVSALKTSVTWMAWAVPLVVSIGMAVVGFVVAVK